MKHIPEHSSLKLHLQAWAPHDKILVSKFFFWRAGSGLQKSASGLLRSLLYQILSDGSVARLNSIDIAKTTIHSTWTEKKLQAPLKTVVEGLANGSRICLLIDGVDEFDGDPESMSNLIDFIKEIVSYPHVKAVISSRPEPFIKEAFRGFRCLRLQDLTLSDIRIYTEQRLFREKQMDNLMQESPVGTTRLIERVCEKADGVFLWARFAVQELLSGLFARDTIPMLRDRLRLLDSSLDGLFSQLLHRIHPVHREKAAFIFHFVTGCINLDMFYSYPPFLNLAFAFDKQLLQNVKKLLLSDDGDNDAGGSLLSSCCRQLDDLLVSVQTQTAGLVDLTESRCSLECRGPNRVSNSGDLSLHAGSLAGDSSSQSSPIFNGNSEDRVISIRTVLYHFYHHVKVNVIHRSVIDFLNFSKHAEMLIGSATPASWNINSFIGYSIVEIMGVLMLVGLDLDPWRPISPDTDFESRIDYNNSLDEASFEQFLSLRELSLKAKDSWTRPGYFTDLSWHFTGTLMAIYHSLDKRGLSLHHFISRFELFQALSYAKPEHGLLVFFANWDPLSVVLHDFSPEHAYGFPLLPALVLRYLNDLTRKERVSTHSFDSVNDGLNLMASYLEIGLYPTTPLEFLEGQYWWLYTIGSVWELYLEWLRFVAKDTACAIFRRAYKEDLASLTELFITRGAEKDIALMEQSPTDPSGRWMLQAIIPALAVFEELIQEHENTPGQLDDPQHQSLMEPPGPKVRSCRDLMQAQCAKSEIIVLLTRCEGHDEGAISDFPVWDGRECLCDLADDFRFRKPRDVVVYWDENAMERTSLDAPCPSLGCVKRVRSA